jgi:hypothetical protein
VNLYDSGSCNEDVLSCFLLGLKQFKDSSAYASE